MGGRGEGGGAQVRLKCAGAHLFLRCPWPTGGADSGELSSHPFSAQPVLLPHLPPLQSPTPPVIAKPPGLPPSCPSSPRSNPSCPAPSVFPPTHPSALHRPPLSLTPPALSLLADLPTTFPPHALAVRVNIHSRLHRRPRDGRGGQTAVAVSTATAARKWLATLAAPYHAPSPCARTRVLHQCVAVAGFWPAPSGC